ncbi:hypothetical protein HGRIS_012384 [Hohenbuehelia grisea]|uniref:Mucoidy inhibitor A n=1 Tax=Hohenbuehelia grisea TaxID=104357 RepID=A0ABR3IS74_9AGAR
MTQGAPPPKFEVNTIDVVSVESSKITGVSLYSGRAEITRLYALSVPTGQNQVKISGLPNVLDHSSLRVEGRGAATIHGVTIAATPVPPIASTSDALVALEHKKERVGKAIARCRKSIAALETFVSSVSTEKINVQDLGSVVNGYEAEGEKLDDKLLELEQLLLDVDKDITIERARLRGSSHRNHDLGQTATISVFAETGGDIELVLIYAVRRANWSATYDIRVDMQTKEKPVTLIYKAAILQSTGESWEDVPLTLETVTPSFGTSLPELTPWRLSVWKPPSGTRHTMSVEGGPVAAGTRVRYRLAATTARKVKGSSSAEGMDDGNEDLTSYFDMAASAPMQHAELNIAAQGAMSATYQVPGLISIPSDGQEHSVTIVQLQLDATMSRVSIPRAETRVHLKAKIKNASEYTLLRGNASVYVDGSFISKSTVPAVSPQENFDCPLGLDPSIRLTYPSVEKKASKSGFYSKTSTQVFTQRITVHNTRSDSIEDLKIVDHIPVSEDSQITVKLNTPALTVLTNTGTLGGKNARPDPVKIAEGVIAQWDGAEEAEADFGSLGKDGKLNWVCTVPAQGKLNLQLQWEVSSPASVTVTGL